MGFSLERDAACRGWVLRTDPHQETTIESTLFVADPEWNNFYQWIKKMDAYMRSKGFGEVLDHKEETLRDKYKEAVREIEILRDARKS